MNTTRSTLVKGGESQYFSVKHFKLSTGLGGKVKGEGVREFSSSFPPYPFPLNRKVLGRIEQVLAAEKLLSVSFEDGTNKVRFDPCELSLLVRAAPLHPICVGDIVFVRIDRHEAASPQQKKWNGYWGQVTQVGEMGSLSVDMGSESLQLFPRDLKPVDAPSASLRQVVERVRSLRRLELDEVESGILDVLQRREWFTPRQLAHLDLIEKFALPADSHSTEHYQVV